MPARKFKLSLSLRTKVLLPVMMVMVLLIVVSTWLSSCRMKQQLQATAAEQLATAEAVFKNSQPNRANNLFLRYRNIVNETRFKSASSLGDAKAFDHLIGELLDEGVADVILLANTNGQKLTAAARDPLMDADAFEQSCAAAIAQALEGQPKVDTVRNGDRLFDVFSLPVRLNDRIAGVATFATENSIAQEFNQWTHSELVLIADGRVVASTLVKPKLYADLANQFARLSATQAPQERYGTEEVRLNDEHFLCTGGLLGAPSQKHRLGYLILSSYEKPLQVLQATQRMVLLVSSLAAFIGGALVWFFVRRVTEPLRELRESAEAVGRGVFTRRVEVRSQDECGELARVFNQMTGNLKNSREQLELTVETLKATQAQLIQSEKLSGIGEFVAGVAHELNNPLTSVMGFSELLKQADADTRHHRYLDLIHKSALRCQKIVQSLLSFARRHQPERKLVCVNRVIEAALDILQYQLRTSNIEVITEFDPQLPPAMIDPHQIQQVFVNILNNARQAIEVHEPKGWIKIITEAGGDNVRITIRDSGPGIASENLSKIFDPFFTTKEVGTGTGLGLSLCYGIIKEHGGTITPRSKAGEGATFVVELPITHEPATATEAREKSPVLELVGEQVCEGSGKRVLVIDDEEGILQMVREALTREGYEVDIACDGEAGLRRLHQADYDLALCDWKMPGLNGQQVYEQLRTINPALSQRIIFITGDMVNDKTREFLEAENKIFLPKPFTLSEFHAAIGKVLAA